jgi:hypothetical protein
MADFIVKDGVGQVKQEASECPVIQDKKTVTIFVTENPALNYFRAIEDSDIEKYFSKYEGAELEKVLTEEVFEDLYDDGYTVSNMEDFADMQIEVDGIEFNLYDDESTDSDMEDSDDMDEEEDFDDMDEEEDFDDMDEEEDFDDMDEMDYPRNEVPFSVIPTDPNKEMSFLKWYKKGNEGDVTYFYVKHDNAKRCLYSFEFDLEGDFDPNKLQLVPSYDIDLTKFDEEEDYSLDPCKLSYDGQIIEGEVEDDAGSYGADYQIAKIVWEKNSFRVEKLVDLWDYDEMATLFDE